MIFRYLLILIILFPIKAFSLIEVDITRGNLSPLPVAVSPLSIDSESKESFEKLLKKKNIGTKISCQHKSLFFSTFFTILAAKPDIASICKVPCAEIKRQLRTRINRKVSWEKKCLKCLYCLK